jgi:menaquinone-dependent protoporphyrinogen oxidase
MRVLVGYATANGSTKGVALAIAERLRVAGLDVDTLALDAVADLDRYDAVVLGSAIHNQRWLVPARVFVKGHAARLAELPLWLFSVSSVGDTTSFLADRAAGWMRRIRPEPREVTGYRRQLVVRGHRNFAGAVEREHWGLAGHLFLRVCGGTYGDHRDWGAINAWADGIAAALGAGEERKSA